MERAYTSRTVAIVAAAVLWFTGAIAHAAPPDIHWVDFDYDARTFNLHGSQLIIPGPGSTSLNIAGSAVTIDSTASSEGELVVPFDNILDALPGLVEMTPEGRVLRAEGIYVLEVVTDDGRDLISAYFPRDVTETPVTPPPPPPGSEPCPCTALYNTWYDSVFALLWPTCSTPESSNRPYAPVPPEQYIEAEMIDELWMRTIIIGSDSSASPRGSRAGKCYVIDGDAPVLTYLGGGPLPVSDAQHMGCVEDIYARESICRGCNWLDDC